MARAPKIKVEPDDGTGLVAEFWNREAHDQASQLFLTLGGIQNHLARGEHPLVIANQVSNAILAAVERPRAGQAEPPPPDVMAMLRLADYFYRTEGDVYQTLNVPAQIILKSVEVDCDDKGAKEVWKHLWQEVLDIDELYSEIFWNVEPYGNCFPLEVWDGDKDLTGIVFIEPTSMWVGRHFPAERYRLQLVAPKTALDSYLNYVTQLKAPQDEGDLARQRLLEQRERDLMYNSFVTDLNVTTQPAYRIPIRPDRMVPVFAPKTAWQRYAVPHIARASRNILHRQVLEEYRRGTIEAYLSQVWLFTVGNEKWPATPNKIRKIRSLLDEAAKNRTGMLVLDHSVTGEVLAPKTLDQILGNETFNEITAMIFRDLGFSLFLVSGEVPGVGGRGGGTQVEIDVQIAIERWKYHQRRFAKWFTALSKKYAAAADPALLRHMPQCVFGAIGIEQTAMIKERIMPLLMAGQLSSTTALRDAGYAYPTERDNKKAEEPDKELFIPAPTFSQTAVDSDGNKSESQVGLRGRPPAAQSPNQTKKPYVAEGAQKVEASISQDVWGQREEAFRAEIDRRFGEEAPDFADWLDGEIPRRMIRAYQDGWYDWGGVGDLTYDALEAAPQGPAFHKQHLGEFRHELQAAPAQDRMKLRPRALLYAGSVHTAYMLGTQAAMKSHGAHGWRRMLHPELSLSGPCDECVADAAVVHAIDEAFHEFHPNGVCSPQSVMFQFANAAPVAVRVPQPRPNVIRRLPSGYTSPAVPSP